MLSAATPTSKFAKQPLLALNRGEFVKIVQESQNTSKRAFPKYQLDAAYEMFHKNIPNSFNELKFIPKDLCAILNEHFSVACGQVLEHKMSFDTTQKWLMTTFDDKPKEQEPATFGAVETVLIPDDFGGSSGGRSTLCLSSQVGCSLACSFCHTGRQKLGRNLTAAEIVAQFVHAARRIGDLPWSVRPRFPTLTNIVFMGQGEPLYNWTNVAAAIDVLADAAVYNFSRSRIAVSTSGIIPNIAKVAEAGVRLAVSLHAPTDELRSQIMAINKSYPLADLMEACRKFQSSRKATERITFEYVLLKDLNDSKNCARDLARLLTGINCHVNLMNFNEWPGASYQPTSASQLHAFANVLKDCGVFTTVRRSRGKDIMAVCGQLSSSSKAEGALNHATVDNSCN